MLLKAEAWDTVTAGDLQLPDAFVVQVLALSSGRIRFRMP